MTGSALILLIVKRRQEWIIIDGESIPWGKHDDNSFVDQICIVLAMDFYYFPILGMSLNGSELDGWVFKYNMLL